MKTILVVIISILLFLSESNAQNHIESYVIGFGGVISENNNYNIQATMGESFIGISQNNNYNSLFGFWANYSMGIPSSNRLLIYLIPTWNMISSNVTPIDQTMNSIFAPLGSNFLIAKDYLGNVYWPEWGIDDIGTWDITKGYQVYVMNEDSLLIIGNSINPITTPINMNISWDMIAYLRNSPMDLPTALASIQGRFLIIKDNIGNVYWPEWGIDDIINMQPGQGYQIYIPEPCILTYPEN